jgi:hypothetical protein
MAESSDDDLQSILVATRASIRLLFEEHGIDLVVMRVDGSQGLRVRLLHPLEELLREEGVAGLTGVEPISGLNEVGKRSLVI